MGTSGVVTRVALAYAPKASPQRSPHTAPTPAPCRQHEPPQRLPRAAPIPLGTAESPRRGATRIAGRDHGPARQRGSRAGPAEPDRRLRLTRFARHGPPLGRRLQKATAEEGRSGRQLSGRARATAQAGTASGIVL